MPLAPPSRASQTPMIRDMRRWQYLQVLVSAFMGGAGRLGWPGWGSTR